MIPDQSLAQLARQQQASQAGQGQMHEHEEDCLLYVACMHNSTSLLNEVLQQGDVSPSNCNYAALRFALSNRSDALVQCFEQSNKTPWLHLFENACELLNIYRNDRGSNVFTFLFQKRSTYFAAVREQFERNTFDKDVTCLVNLAYLQRFWDCFSNSYTLVDRICESQPRFASFEIFIQHTAMQLTLVMLQNTCDADMCCYLLRKNAITLDNFNARPQKEIELQSALNTYEAKCVSALDKLAVALCFTHQQQPTRQNQQRIMDCLAEPRPQLQSQQQQKQPAAPSSVASTSQGGGRSILEEAQEARRNPIWLCDTPVIVSPAITVATTTTCTGPTVSSASGEAFWQTCVVQAKTALASISHEQDEKKEKEEEVVEEEGEKAEIKIYNIDWKRALRLVVQQHHTTPVDWLQHLYITLIRAKYIASSIIVNVGEDNDFEESAFMCAGEYIFKAIESGAVDTITQHQVEFFSNYVTDAIARNIE